MAQSIGITAIMSGFILKYCERQSNIYHLALGYAKHLLEQFPHTTEFGDIGIKGYKKLLEDIESAELTEELNYEHFDEKMQQLLCSKLSNEDFMLNPLDFISSENDKFYMANKGKIEAALDRVIEQRTANGVWEIPWEWYNGNKYPDAFAISINWEKISYAIEKLLQLKRFDRLEL